MCYLIEIADMTLIFRGFFSSVTRMFYTRTIKHIQGFKNLIISALVKLGGDTLRDWRKWNLYIETCPFANALFMEISEPVFGIL